MTATARASAGRVTAGIATAVVGALSVLSAVTPDVPGRRHLLLAVEPGPALGLAHVLATFGGLALIYLGRSIVRRRRQAVDLTIMVLLGLAVAHLVKGLDYEEAGVALALAGVLYGSRRACHRGGS